MIVDEPEEEDSGMVGQSKAKKKNTLHWKDRLPCDCLEDLLTFCMDILNTTDIFYKNV